MRTILITASIVFALDQALKAAVLYGLGLARCRPPRIDWADHCLIEVAPPWFRLTMAWNQGINFGLFDLGDNGRWVLIGIALAIVAGLMIWARRMTGLRAVAVGAVVGGALGNVLDRLIYGAVADFLNFGAPGIRNPFAFNLADTAIFLGAVALVLLGTGDARARAR